MDVGASFRRWILTLQAWSRRLEGRPGGRHGAVESEIIKQKEGNMMSVCNNTSIYMYNIILYTLKFVRCIMYIYIYLKMVKGNN